MKEKLQRFMMGRYGVDQFSKFLNIASIVLLILSMFSRFTLIYLLAIILIIYSYVRMFSKNHAKRYAENNKYLRMTAKFRGFFSRQKQYRNIQRTHHIYSCPSCHQKIKVPRGKGRIAIRCPKCSTEFIKKS